jgi:hypothetical protein
LLDLGVVPSLYAFSYCILNEYVAVRFIIQYLQNKS